MDTNTQNPGASNAGAQVVLINWNAVDSTASALQAQRLSARFGLSPWVARTVASLCYGGADHA